LSTSFVTVEDIRRTALDMPGKLGTNFEKMRKGMKHAGAMLLALGVVALALAGSWQRAASVSLLTPADVTGPLSDEEGPPLNLNGNVMQVRAPRADARMMALTAEHSSRGAKHGRRTQQLGPGAVPMRGVTDMGDCPVKRFYFAAHLVNST
jgi:hypothetical protein